MAGVMQQCYSREFEMMLSLKHNTISEIGITPEHICLNGAELSVAGTGMSLLNEAYRSFINDYPKFFKMDGLCKLGFIASELMISQLGEDRSQPREDRAVILFNRSGSLDADKHYQSTISDADNYFPSPSVFVYTLPNIITGEISIRNKYLGETSFYVLDHYEEETIQKIIHISFMDEDTKSMLTGWVDYYDSSHFEAKMKIITK